MHTDYAGHASGLDARHLGGIATKTAGNGAERAPTIMEECVGRIVGSNDRLESITRELRELLDDRIGPPPPSPGEPETAQQVAPATARRLMGAISETETLLSRLYDEVQRLHAL